MKIYNNKKNKKNSFLALLFYVITGSACIAYNELYTTIKEPGTADKEALKNSDGSTFVPKDYYPKFDWEVTPTYAMFGDRNLLTPDQVKFIADRTNFLCIEKAHGVNALGAAELGAKHEVTAFKKGKKDIKVLFYFNAAYAWPFTSYNKAFKKDEIDTHPQLKKFLLVDPQTGELAHRRNIYCFDVLNPDFRQWWIKTVVQGVKETGSDGVFIDQMHGFSWLRKDRKDDVHNAMGEMMSNLKKALGNDKILLGNNSHTETTKNVFDVVDAIMIEHYNYDLLSKENLLKDWGNMQRAAKAGKILIFRVGVNVEPYSNIDENKEKRRQQMEELSKERIEFYLSCFLIGAQPYSFFQYGWGFQLHDGGALVDYPELSKPLGAPLGAYQRESEDKWIFTREFEHASVWVDTEKREAKITWNK